MTKYFFSLIENGNLLKFFFLQPKSTKIFILFSSRLLNLSILGSRRKLLIKNIR
jgi:hypothetical protein